MAPVADSMFRLNLGVVTRHNTDTADMQGKQMLEIKKKPYKYKCYICAGHEIVCERMTSSMRAVHFVAHLIPSQW